MKNKRVKTSIDTDGLRQINRVAKKRRREKKGRKKTILTQKLKRH